MSTAAAEVLQALGELTPEDEQCNVYLNPVSFLTPLQMPMTSALDDTSQP